MYPSWGNYGAPPSQGYGGSGPRKLSVGGHTGQAGGFGGFEASSSSSSLFSSLEEQHRQQMEQLQMLHKKQLQSVLHHGNSASGFGGGHSGGFPGSSSWHSEGTGHVEGGGGQSYLKQENAPAQMPRIRPQQHPPPPPPQQPAESQPVPPPPDSLPPEGSEPPKAKEPPNKDSTTNKDNQNLPLQEQQHVWYKQHLENLQKLKQEKGKLNQNQGDASMPPQPLVGQPPQPPLPPSEPPKSTPPPPPPKEEPSAPPPPPVGLKGENVGKPQTVTDTPEAPNNSEEAVRLQQLQAAAAQWQQVQQQRASIQYQALMQQHEKLQQILEQYQQLIQQPSDLQAMTAELQLRHYGMQQQQFTSLFQNWVASFALWYEQFQTYPHKDQLQEYEHQWKQWQEQMAATNVHLQERVTTLSAIVPFAMMGQLGQYPAQEIQMQQQPVNPGVQKPPVTVSTIPPSQQPPAFVAQAESPAGPTLQGSVPTGVGVRPPGPLTGQPSSFNDVIQPRQSRFDIPPLGFDGPPRFDKPPPSFDGPPRFDKPPPGFDGPPRFDKPPPSFDGPPRFNHPPPSFDGPPRFTHPPPAFDGPPRFNHPPPTFDGTPRFDQPKQRFDGPPSFDHLRPRFDGPPRFDSPRPRFDGPPRFDQPQQRFDAPHRYDQPRFGQPPRFESQRPLGPSASLESPPALQQKQQQPPQPKSMTAIEQPARMDSKTPSKPPDQPQSDKDKKEQCFEGPPRFDPQRQRFDAPSRYDQPRFGQQPRFESPRPLGPSSSLECPPALQQKQQQAPQPKSETTNEQLASMDSKTPSNPPDQPQSDKDKQRTESVKSILEDMSDDSLLGTEGFFVQNDPIPQTLPTSTQPEKTAGKTISSDSEKGKPSVTTDLDPVSKMPAQNSLKADGPLIQHTLEIKSEPQGSGKMLSNPEPLNSPLGRGRGQSPVHGRGQMGPGQFRGPNAVQAGEEVGEMPYNCMPPEESIGIQAEQEKYQWQDPSYEEFGGNESGVPPEETWVPEEHYFEDDEYYEGPVGPHMGRGRPPIRGGPPMGRGGPPMGRGGPPMGRGGPPMGRGGPPMGRGGPPMGRGGPPMGRGGPPMGRGGPPMGRGMPPMWRGGPPMGRGRPPMWRGGPPLSRGGPPMGRGGLPMGRGEPMERPWEDAESAEYYEDGDPYGEEWRPPMRGMRPPFPPGRGRPPHGHPGFMPPGRGRPPHPLHGQMDHEPLGHEIESDDANLDPSMHPVYHGHDPFGHPMYPDIGRGRRRVPPPPHELMEPMEEPLYEEAGGEEWHPPPGRGPPMPPHEILDRGGIRRRPLGRGMGRGMWRPGSEHEEYEEGFNEGYTVDYEHGRDAHRLRSVEDYPPDDYRHEAKYHESVWDRERELPEGDYPPRIPPPEHVRGERWHQEAERDRLYPYDDNSRARGELRIREYRDELPYRQEESDWDRPSRLPPPHERGYPDSDDRRPPYDEHRKDSSVDLPPRPVASASDLPGSSAESSSQGANVLALSQRQHEIILKAAQELKQIRELQHIKPPTAELQTKPSESLPELPAGLLGLEIPPDVRNVLKGISAAAQTAPEQASWESKSAADYKSPLSSNPPLISKTVDYGHGHDHGTTTVERISYGERIVLRPDPMPSDRGYDKEHLALRDPYDRDPYFERRLDPYMDRREYSRERELYREKPPEYERDRYERDRYHSRERDDSTHCLVEERSPLASSLRSGYRDRDRDRDKDRSGSRDRDERYGRPGYDRPPYERPGPERVGSDRYGSPFMDRRGFPEDRGPHSAAPLAPPLPAPTRIEKKPEIKNIDDILKPPGRVSRPERIVIIMRGLPGSGKSHVAKLIRDKEVECGGAPPRVLVLDDYFMTEVEKVQKDPDTGKRVKTKVLEYEYEPEMEDTYRSSMLKTFRKTLDDGFFPFIILDTINDRVKHFDQFWSAAKTKGFEVYVAEITADNQTCAKRNVHGRTLKDIMKMSSNWEPSPRHMVRLDVRSLLQDAAIEEVEMEDFNPEDEPQAPKREEEEESDLGYIPKSKWEMDTSEAKLDKLDGLGISGKRKREGDHLSGLEDFLQLPDDYATRTSEPGKKRVRWADLEEKKDAERKRAIGFVVGQTDWEKITDESGQLAQRALNRTKYF
ncbi:YLP motif-containing protein 1 isoform X2 [Kryptolebias marmoratus]|uniref:YLP motif-containing protein 1 isoform X2 n=1 Tax=Kryptolebias marmoratus TaxID=37003 RepID=UPI0007F88F88|nr:YLP motif-containing protein 1 isoform X2 [Kryptolebias marmoratus]